MRFFVLAFAIICAIFDYFDFLSNFELSYILRIVTLVQKLRKSFFGKIEFVAPSRSAGSALTPNTPFGKIYRRFHELCSSF